jgi:diadenosine tetraphosphate (Ap4A) HIT family hydrolase
MTMGTSASDGWSADWFKWKTGQDCPFCAEGRPDEREIGIRFHAGEVLDAYLLRGSNAFGSTMTVWRGRHIADPTEMTDDELCAYWLEVQHVSRELETRYAPIKLNYFTHGTHVPHLHTVIVLRYADDAAPNATLLWRFDATAQDDAVMRREVDALRRAMSK